MSGRCPKCNVEPNVIVEAIRARADASAKTWPAVLFLCDHCRAILGVSLDPDWQAQVAAGHLRSVAQGSDTNR